MRPEGGSRLRFVANLTTLFPEHPLIDRVDAAREVGFRNVEVQFPYDIDPAEFERRLQWNDCRLVLFNLPAGDWDAGDRGIAGNPDRVAEFREGVLRAAELARLWECTLVNCLVGRRVDGVTLEEQRELIRDNIAFAAEQLSGHSIRVVVEPLNEYDHPGFLLSRAREVADMARRLGTESADCQLLYDVYHVYRMGDDVLRTFDEVLPHVGHIQISDCPGRHEPGSGEIPIAEFLRVVSRSPYQGYVSLEYFPTADTRSSLDWVARLGLSLQA